MFVGVTVGVDVLVGVSVGVDVLVTVGVIVFVGVTVGVTPTGYNWASEHSGILDAPKIGTPEF